MKSNRMVAPDYIVIAKYRNKQKKDKDAKCHKC
nr:MAG TPA: hypothetical protein [Herelleviridae sp.]